jgi:phosphoglycerol transferase MdoB-like AlkP superfamily enzyme
MENNKSSSSGIGIFMILFLIFLVLKLCGVIDWSWWWVTAPLWGMFALIFGLLGIGLIVSLFVILIASLFRKKRK